MAQEAGAELVRLDQRSGPAVARNTAAKNAAGDILIFMDADTSVHPDTLARIASKFRETPELDAVMGSYDQRPSAPGVVSQFRNLLHSFVHHRASHYASTFWAGCGAVRKDRFRSFDESGFDLRDEWRVWTPNPGHHQTWLVTVRDGALSPCRPDQRPDECGWRPLRCWSPLSRYSIGAWWLAPIVSLPSLRC